MGTNYRRAALRARTAGQERSRQLPTRAVPARILPPPSLSQELSLARRASVNMMLIGTAAACDAIVDTARPALTGPITLWRMGQPLMLPPPDAAGTLVLRGVEALDVVDQLRLCAWLEAAPDVVVLSTALPSILWGLERGTFLDTLYYRLNTVCIPVV